MRKQIAAANWKMNCTLHEAEKLLDQLARGENFQDDRQVVIAVPFPYLLTARKMLDGKGGYFVSAQNCSARSSGAYTGEVSASMIASCGVTHVIIGHSERRQYFGESDEVLREKVLQAIANQLTPIFCCGEPLEVREKTEQNQFVASQIREALFGMDEKDFNKLIIAYEPIWAIGTGKTATAAEAQEMHHHIRQLISGRYGDTVASEISILYGGSVNAENAEEIFRNPDVDGGLVGGASLKADQFQTIIMSLKS